MIKDNIQELLKLRYKIVGDFPGSTYNLGEVIIVNDPESYFHDRYPHIFKRLRWYEERRIEEMPEYIKCDEKVFKVKEYEPDSVHGYIIIPYSGSYSAILADDPECKPATEQEYLTYISKNRQNG